MSEAITLLAEIFLIGCLHEIVRLLIDADKMPYFSKIASAAFGAAALFVLARFVVANLMPQMVQVFRVVL